jgi:predicted component of type VI protein secretion system
MKSLTGQYECAHRSGLGLDYFTARVDRLTLYANGRFTLITQEKSRLAHAAKSLASGQQASMDAPETRAEGSYSSQGNLLILHFDTGEQEQAQILEAGLQFTKDFFEKVADSTFMPPPQRVKSNMEDIAKGLKIAGAIGGTVLKAAKTIQDTLQSSQQGQQGTPANAAPPAAAQPAGQAPPSAPAQSWQAPPAAPLQSAYSQAQPAPGQLSPQDDETLFCDQCGMPVRPGKKFCNHCGARLP